MKTFMKVLAASAVAVAMTASAGDWYYDGHYYQDAEDRYEECITPSSFSGRPTCTLPPSCEEFVDSSSFSGWPSCEEEDEPELYCGHFTNRDGYLTVRNVYVDSLGDEVGPVLFYEVEPLVFEVREYIQDGVKHYVK